MWISTVDFQRHFYNWAFKCLGAFYGRILKPVKNLSYGQISPPDMIPGHVLLDLSLNMQIEFEESVNVFFTI